MTTMMSETTNKMNTRPPARVHAGEHTEGAAGTYYRAYYRELVTRGAGRAERRSRLEIIRTARRRARREKWLREIKSLASVVVGPEAVN
jgi:hypothetical protein